MYLDKMSELFFNINNGYLEGLVRGFKGGVLKQTDYLNLVQCETLEGEESSYDLRVLLTVLAVNLIEVCCRWIPRKMKTCVKTKVSFVFMLRVI